MRRLQLVELHDLPWFPAAWRDPFTDFMAFYSERLGPYSQVHPVLADALRHAGSPPGGRHGFRHVKAAQTPWRRLRGGVQCRGARPGEASPP